MLKSHSTLIYQLVIVADVVASLVLFWLVTACVAPVTLADCWSAHPAKLGGLVALAALTFPVALHPLGLYDSRRRDNLTDVCTRLLAAAAISSFVVGTGSALLAIPLTSASPFYFGSAQFAVLGVGRLLVHAILRLARRRGRNFRNVFVVGSGPRALRVRNLLNEHSEWGFRLMGFVDDQDTAVANELASEPIYKTVELPALLQREVIDEIIVAYPRSMLGSVAQIVGLCSQIGVPVTVLSDLFGDDLPPPQVGHLESIPALSFAPVHHSSVQLVAKRWVDLLGASAALLLVSPILLAAAIAIRVNSPGSILFRQERCGLHGRRFQILKLRTMMEDAEARREEILHLNERRGPTFKIRDDPRITPVGRFLRRWSIDELPQLWNVIRGEMSLVGPRPPIPREVDEYQITDQRRLSMRPGLTCLWQISGRSEIDFRDQVKLDLEYIDGWSFSNDIKIIVRTVPAVILGRGAS